MSIHMYHKYAAFGNGSCILLWLVVPSSSSGSPPSRGSDSTHWSRAEEPIDVQGLRLRVVELENEVHDYHDCIAGLEKDLVNYENSLDESLQRASFFEIAFRDSVKKLSQFHSRMSDELMDMLESENTVLENHRR